MKKSQKTNYKNSLVNLSASLIKYYGGTPKYESHAFVDFLLSKKYRHVALICIDGMGIKAIDDNLGNGSILKTHQIITLNSVFPPTTVAATTALRTGNAPIESGYLGWHLYLKDEEPSVVLFNNKEYYSGKDVDYKVTDIIPCDPFFKNGLKRAKAYEVFPSFAENGCETFHDAIEILKENFNKDENNFTYVYWDNPDHVMHEYGVTSQVTKVKLIEIEEEIQELSDNLPQDCIVLITADHGLIDGEPIDLSKNTALYNTLSKKISGEPRFTQFYVKEDQREVFESEFENSYKDSFILYTKEEFIKSNLAGIYEMNPICEKALGDYCAIATKEYFFMDSIDDEANIFKGVHAGLTKEEMQVPVILLKHKEKEIEEE